MNEKLRFMFDEKGDILDISIGKPKKAISKPLEDDILVRINPKTKKIVGFTILNFRKRFKDSKTVEKIDTPIRASLSLA
ncbi:MAG TPA: DUF2283 domain-containing protein [Candidatus Acidoferrum sp.]|nr:DUF2283 domain-containing protein [Candidatus Acidoferrum sp.]